MGDQGWLDLLRHHRAIAVIQAPTLAVGVQLAQAVAAAGMGLIEVTWRSDRPTALVAQLRERLPHCHIGAGTVLTPGDLQAAIAAGAQFIFMPHTQADLIAQGREQGLPMVPGALTPTEIVAAWQAGASAVKVFPVPALVGAPYWAQLRGPFPQIPLIPTGGVGFQNGPALLAAGAIAVGVSTALFPPAMVQAQDWPAITQRAVALRQCLQGCLPEGD